jgi:hypothetical protein
VPRPVAPLLSREQIASAALGLIDEAGTFTLPGLAAQTVSDERTLATYEALARVLRDAGFRDEELLHAVTILDCFILGSALDAAAPLDVWADSDDPESALGAAIRTARAEPERRSERSFEIGLRIILAGLGELRA